jgi:hypothetical protein
MLSRQRGNRTGSWRGPDLKQREIALRGSETHVGLAADGNLESAVSVYSLDRQGEDRRPRCRFGFRQRAMCSHVEPPQRRLRHFTRHSDS